MREPAGGLAHSRSRDGGNADRIYRVPVAMIGPLRHHRMRRMVGAYLDGELGGDARAEVARHLSVCWECSTVAETIRLIRRSLRQRGDRSAMSRSERRLRQFAVNLASERTSRPRRRPAGIRNKQKGIRR